MSNPSNGTNDLGDVAITRRRMLTKLGLAAGAIYAAPVLVPLSEARASSGGHASGPGRRRRSRGRDSWTKASFSRSRRRGVRHDWSGPYHAGVHRGRVRVGSFSR
jgi:hypothetical protein